MRLPKSLQLFDGSIPTIVFNLKEHSIDDLKTVQWKQGVHYYQVTEDVSVVQQMLNALYKMNIQSILVEGGTYLLQSFIDEGIWDEARIITNEKLFAGSGLPAPQLKNSRLTHSETILTDTIRTFEYVKP